MSELITNDINEQPNNKASFCRKCGHRLLANSEYCANCGTAVKYTDDNLSVDDGVIQEDEHNNVISQNYVGRKKKFKGIVLGAFILTIIIVAGFFVSKLIVKPQNINDIAGCPEFYDLEWGMSADVADKKIKLEHIVFKAVDKSIINTFNVSDDLKDSKILIEEDEKFYLYGKRAEDVFVGFDGDSLDSVIITFSKENYTLDEIIELYVRIYGQATESETLYASWNGSKTTIDVYDYEPISDDGDKTIVVRYLISENIAFSSITFNGDELDPCGFLSSNYAFDKKPDYYIKGLKKGEDYDVEEFSPGGEFSVFSQYTLYPSFKYMGIDNGMTAIEFNKDENEEYIGLVSYKFLLDEENATDRISHIHSKLMEKYGTPNDISYTSTYYAKMGIKNLTFEKMMEQISENTEGIYHIQWKQGKRNITLGLTISVDKEYYEGSVAYTD